MRVLYYVLAAAAICVAAAVLWHFFNRGSAVRNYPSNGTDIVLFGDSLASGVGAGKGEDLGSDLSILVGKPVVNLGRAGDTTEDALKRIGELDNYHPKVVVIVLGGNDYLQHLDMNEAFNNLGKIVSAAQSRGAIVLLVGLRLNPLVGNFDPQFRNLAKLYKTAYVPDALDGIFGTKDLMADDVHPNVKGYQLMAERIAPTLQKLIE